MPSQTPTPHSPLPTPQSLIYKMVDTCGGEFEAKTPYFYSIQNGTENEALPFIRKSGKPRIVVLGSGPIRIGQGIEFDYACVHCAPQACLRLRFLRIACRRILAGLFDLHKSAGYYNQPFAGFFACFG